MLNKKTPNYQSGLGFRRQSLYKVLDLFSGAGGMAEGFLQSGFSIPFASDKSEQAALTYKNRHSQLGLNTKYYCGDVSNLSNHQTLKEFLGDSITEIDVICGGPPCQGFSLAGKRNPLDKRNQLVQSYIKILSLVKPKYFVMENVLGILSAKFVDYQGLKISYINKNVVDVLKSEFAEIGYPDVEIRVLDASDFGVPQKRQRVIFLGTRKDIQNKLLHPASPNQQKVSAKHAIDDLADITIGSKQTIYQIQAQTDFQRLSRAGRTKILLNTGLANHETSKHTPLVVERFAKLNNGENIKNMLLRLDEQNAKRLKTKKQNCRKIQPDHPSPTVLTLPDDLVHYSQNRILTVREMARLQSFDDSFEFLGKRTTGGDRRKLETPQYTLVGNAVPPLLAKAIADEVMENLKAESSIEPARKTAL